MATLYELTGDLRSLYEMAQDPEIDEETLRDTMEAVEGEFEIKADGYAKVLAELEGDSAKIQAEIERLSAKKKTMDNSYDRIKKTLYEAMKSTGKEKFKTELFNFGIRKNGGKKPLKINEGITTDDLPAEFIKWGDPEIDKKAIREALEAGEELQFAHLEERGESLQIK